ncbi:MAG: metallopeptidase TldD-related protein, partial [Chloroflexota bacterium]|nr:metallopeptidase TldD-related protein [Chloroflexota bacterium]
HNPLHGIPGPADVPDVPIADPDLQADPGAALDGLLARLRVAVDAHPRVRLTAAEFFAEEQTTQLCNSRGINATQTETMVDLEWVLLCREGDREVESFVEMSRRRAADIELEAEVARRAKYAIDTLDAAPGPDFSGPVVMRGETLATFLNGGVLQTLSSGAAKFNRISPWEIGQSVFRGAVEGDPLTVFANRQLPFGTHASRFDDEGLPAQRVPLIRDNVLATFIANQRYADYLKIAATGAFGDIELPAGSTPTASLLQEPYVETVTFSWFNPDALTGEFASEIRLGYLVDGGKRTPFKGGVLVGNVLDALANVRWSAETGFYGDYQGPTTARFGNLTVAGAKET